MQFVQVSALFSLQSVTKKIAAKLLGSKTLMSSYILFEFWSFSKRISPQPFGMSRSNFQRSLKLLCCYNIQKFHFISFVR